MHAPTCRNDKGIQNESTRVHKGIQNESTRVHNGVQNAVLNHYQLGSAEFNYQALLNYDCGMQSSS